MAEQFLPDDEGFDVDEAFADLSDSMEEALVVEETPPPFGRSWAMDFASRRFVVIQAHGPQQTFGLDTLRMWVVKCLNTARGAHPIHPDGYGLDRPFDIVGLQFDEFQEADLAERIVEALTFHPRITNVTDFDFTFDPVEEALHGAFTVVVDDSDEIVISGVSLG